MCVCLCVFAASGDAETTDVTVSDTVTVGHSENEAVAVKPSDIQFILMIVVATFTAAHTVLRTNVWLTV